MNHENVPAMFMASTSPCASMFQGLNPKIGPTADEMEEERKRVLSHRHVEMTEHKVKIFNMHDATDVAAYEKLMQVLVKGTQALTHKIWVNERTLVTQNGSQQWMCYMEWSVFRLDEDMTPPLGTQDRKRKRSKILG